MLTRFRKVLAWVLVGAVGLSIVPVLFLRFMPPPTSAFMLRRGLANLVSRQGAPIRYHWTGWAQISPSMRVAVVAAEDQKFLHHWGFDYVPTVRFWNGEWAEGKRTLPPPVRVRAPARRYRY
ncbi:MAG: transglycosylase domain-containing protein [Acidobacteria bacterium]|nr:transglycosylase domain-containing protein [Acidobacteriota bacterium]